MPAPISERCGRQKNHETASLLRLSGALYAWPGRPACSVWSISRSFQVLLSEEENPPSTSHCWRPMDHRSGDGLPGDCGRTQRPSGRRSEPCQGMALVAVVCNLVTIFTATRCGQIWYPFAAGLALTFLFLYGIQKEVESWDKPVRKKNMDNFSD